MKRDIKPAKQISGTLTVPGDKSIAHRAAIISILAKDPLEVKNYPDGDDCRASLNAAKALGVTVETADDGSLTLTPPEAPAIEPDTIIDCGNSGTTARLLSGVLAGSKVSAIMAGDESLSARPMKRVADPLSDMGAEVITTEGHLPVTIHGKTLLPYEYLLPVPSAQVKSSLLLAGLASGCSVIIREEVITRDHTERMLAELGCAVENRVIKPERIQDPNDPRKSKLVMPESFKKEITLPTRASVNGGTIDIPGDFSTAAFFFALAALSKQSITVENVGLNPTRTAFLDHLRIIGCNIDIADKMVISGEQRASVTVSGGPLKGRKLSGDATASMIDELPLVAILAAVSAGTTVIRDAGELRVKESDRLAAVAHNLQAMGISCGQLEDGLAIEGRNELNGGDLKAFGDHRIAMAFSIAATTAVGPSTLDDDSVVAVSCPHFYEMLNNICQ